MNNAYLPFALPEIEDEEIDAVVACMKSGWLTTGVHAKTFEQNFANYIGDGVQALAVNSATMGLLLALEASGVKAGDEVIVPTYSFSSSAMVAVYLGARPVLVDVNPLTLNIDPSSVMKAITKSTKAIVVVHFAGLSADLDSIRQIAKENNLKVIEDAAHALPTTYNGQLIGKNTSDATVYSFYATKTITTGEGGMIVSSNNELIERCKVMRLHGFSRDVFDRYTTKGSKWYYEVVAPGIKSNLTDIASCIGIEQLKKVDRFWRRRVEIANKYLEAFKGLPITMPAQASKGDKHSWHLFVIRLNDEMNISREDFIIKMSEQGIGCSVHFIPIHTHPYYQQTFGYKNGMFPNAEKAFSKAVSLPIYTKMTDEDVERVIKAVKNSI